MAGTPNVCSCLQHRFSFRYGKVFRTYNLTSKRKLVIELFLKEHADLHRREKAGELVIVKMDVSSLAL